jgi:hypothetical protein
MAAPIGESPDEPVVEPSDDLLPDELALLRAIAAGQHLFRARAEDDAQMWLRQLNRLRLLRDLGLISFRESVREGGDGMPVLVGPCELTPAGIATLQRQPT